MLFKYFIIDYFRHRLYSPWSFFSLILSIFLNLFIFYFTAKVFVPKPGALPASFDYFIYMVVGELALILPQFFLHEALEVYERHRDDGTWLTMHFSPLSVYKKLTLIFVPALMLKCFVLFLTLVIMIIFFGTNLSLMGILCFFSFQLLALPCFFGLSFFSLGIFHLTGRGRSLQAYINILISALSGAYFPLAVFGDHFWVKALGQTPWALHLELSRGILVFSGNQLEFYSLLVSFLKLSLWSLLFISLGHVFYRFVINGKFKQLPIFK